MLTCSVPLCERCARYDWERTGDIKAAFGASGIKDPESIWCLATDRPEDLRWKHCGNFREYGHGSN